MLRIERGFTLVELLVVVTIAAVIAGFAVPNMSQFLRNNARTACVNSMVTAINYARSQAITLNQRVTVCEANLSSLPASPTATSYSCSNGTSAPTTGIFEVGALVFSDTDATQGAYDSSTTNGDTVLRAFQLSCGGATLRATDSGGTAMGFLSYDGKGMPDVASFGGMQIQYCDDRGATQSRATIVGPTGQPRVSRDSNSNGTHEGLSGADLSCS